MNASRHSNQIPAYRVGVSLALAAAVLLAVLSPRPARATCPNEAIREQQTSSELPEGSIHLPDCMALEMVSPAHKGGQPARTPVVSANGERVRFLSVAALGGTPGSISGSGDPYVATRGGSEWVTASTSPPVEIVRGWDGSATALSFTPDFSRWFHIGSTQAQMEVGIGQAFEGGLGGIFSPISPTLVPVKDGEREDVQLSLFQGASADHSHLYFIPGGDGLGDTTTAYIPGDPEPTGSGADHNTYVARTSPGEAPALELLARDKFGKIWGGKCGSRLGGIGPTTVGYPAPNGERNQGAVSADGSRVYFSARASQPASGSCSESRKLRILVRQETEMGPEIRQLFSSECSRVSPPCDLTDGDDLYQSASIDGTKVYFTTNRQLANSDLDSGSGCNSEVGESEGCDLYLYDSILPPGERLIQVSAGGAGDPTPGQGAEVLNGVTAISGDGSHVYFVAEGVLTTEANPAGDTAELHKPNLYLYERDSSHPTGRTYFIGTLSEDDGKGLWGGGARAYPVPVLGEDTGGKEVGGDGRVLFFQAEASLTPDDGDGGHRDMYRYSADATPPTLELISKALGASIDSVGQDVELRGTGDAPGTDFAESERWASEEGNSAVFSSKEGLLPGEADGIDHFYLWRDGQIYVLPGVADGPKEVVMSHDGSTIAFGTFSQLLPQDGDASTDIYVARADGGYPKPQPAEPCVPNAGDACQGAAPSPPPPLSLGSTRAGPGNPPRPACPKGKRRVRKQGKARCVPRHPRHVKRPHRHRAHYAKQGGSK